MFEENNEKRLLQNIFVVVGVLPVKFVLRLNQFLRRLNWLSSFYLG